MQAGHSHRYSRKTPVLRLRTLQPYVPLQFFTEWERSVVEPKVSQSISKYLENTNKKTRVIKKEVEEMKYVCDVCGWVYDEEAGYPEGGIAPGTKFEDLPEDFICPLCQMGKQFFSEVSE